MSLPDAPATLTDDTLAEIETAAAEIAAAAGALLLDRFRTKLTVEYKSAGHRDPVTAADRDAERLVRESVLRRFPRHGVLGEEGSDPPPGAAFVWVVDPLDGTTNYVNGLPLWCVSIGVLWHGRPVVGAIFTPAGPLAAPAVFRARLDHGAFMNDVPVHVVEEPEPTRRRLATLPAHYWRELRFRSRGPGRLGEARTLGSTALELALIASGTLQYGIFWGPKIWDVAAGVAIIREAHGLSLSRPGRGRPWSDLQVFTPRRPSRATHATLRAWKGSVVAGGAPAVRVITADIRARLNLPALLQQEARRLLPSGFGHTNRHHRPSAAGRVPPGQTQPRPPGPNDS